jgi:hypothetical protein
LVNALHARAALIDGVCGRSLPARASVNARDHRSRGFANLDNATRDGRPPVGR